jgi:hypothetical protein
MNTFAIHDIVAAVASAAVAALFCFRGWRQRDAVQALFAAYLASGSAYCVVIFFQDNLVPAGLPSESVADAAQRALLLGRLAYAVGLLSLAVQLHFVLRYSGSRAFLGQHVWLVYVAAAALNLVVWRPGFLEAAEGPAAPTSSWLNCVPWTPIVGPLALVFAACWVGVHVYSQAVLGRYQQQTERDRWKRTRVGAVRLAFATVATGGVAEMIYASTGTAGIALMPFFLLVTAVVVGASLARERRPRSG